LALGLKQVELAYLLRIKGSTWSNYEQGTRRPDIEEAVALANLTGVSLDLIYRGIEAALPSDLVRKLREAEEREQNAQ
jgi:transcriptional regulator with XRE-family HTH domain